MHTKFVFFIMVLGLSFGNNDPDNINPTATDTTESSNVVTDDETTVDNSAGVCISK